jgi:hypothetical protein
MSKAVRELLYDLWRTDKTPVYSYPGDCTAKSLSVKAADRFDDLPPRPGQRWWTPRERIENEYPGGVNALMLARPPSPRGRKK